MSDHHEKMDFKGISQKVNRNEYIDGFSSVFFGIFMIIYGLVFFDVLLSISSLLCIPAFAIVTKKLRERYTYPRLGYFRMNILPEDFIKAIPGMLLFATTAVILFLIILGFGSTPSDSEKVYRFLPILVGFLSFGPSHYLVILLGQRKYYLIGIIATIFGLGIVWINLENAKLNMSIFLFLFGIIFCINGVFTFIRFIKNYPIIADSEYMNLQEDSDEF
ncbi:MAG: hypothetical protein ACW97W_13610 [Candidatus Hodarchaeales archaeon]|jgi:hypothetical protein